MSSQKAKRHSIRSLVTDITGKRLSTVEEQLHDESGKTEKQDKQYNAAYQEIKRIINILQKRLSYMDFNITNETKNGFICFMRELYFGGSIREIYTKLRRGKTLTKEEYCKIFELYIEKMTFGGKEKQAYEEHIRQEIDNYCLDLTDKIKKRVTKDLIKINQIENHETRKAFLQKYQELIFMDSPIADVI